MADQVFNIAKGSFIEKFRDSAAAGGLMLLKTAESDATLIDYDTLAQILGGSNVEADFTNYARKTGLTGTITVDDTNNRVDLDIPDQTWSAAGGASNNTLAKAIFFYQESAADSGRVPISHHDFVVTTDGSDVTLQVNAAGIARAS
jgi:hypothetical protein